MTIKLYMMNIQTFTHTHRHNHDNAYIQTLLPIQRKMSVVGRVCGVDCWGEGGGEGEAGDKMKYIQSKQTYGLPVAQDCNKRMLSYF